MTSELKEVILDVQDMNRQVTFYSEALGLRVKEPQGVKDFREFYAVELDMGQSTLLLHSSDKLGAGEKRKDREDREDGPMIVFQVEDIEATCEELLKRDIQVGEMQVSVQGVKVCEVRDPEGNALMIAQRKMRSTASRDVSSPSTRIATTGPLSISATSLRGRLITLLRQNKLAIALEIALVLGTLYFFEFLQISIIFPLLFVITGLFWLRGSNWKAVGIAQPKNALRTIILGISAALFILLMESFIIGPMLNTILGQSPDLHVFDPIQGNVPLLLGALVTTWTSAAIGEEAVFRGYLFNRLTDLFGASRVGWTIALIGQALAFGSIHAYQGIAGMAAATLFGLLSGLLYLANQRNLWLTVITHGLIDTASFLLTFVGMS